MTKWLYARLTVMVAFVTQRLPVVRQQPNGLADVLKMPLHVEQPGVPKSSHHLVEPGPNEIFEAALDYIIHCTQCVRS